MRPLLLPAAVALLLAGCSPSRPTTCLQADELRQRMAPLGDKASSELRTRLANLDASCRSATAPSRGQREIACDSARAQAQRIDKLGSAASPEQLQLLREVQSRCQSESAAERGFLLPRDEGPDDPVSRAKALRQTP